MLREAAEAARALAEGGGSTAERFRREIAQLEMLAERGLALEGISAPLELGGRRAWNTDETGPGDGAAGWVAIEVPRADHDRAYLMTVVAWGKSDGFTPVICTEGGGKGTAAGGVWTKLTLIEGRLSGEEQWDTLVFRAEPEQFDPEIAGAKLGFGGGDSQIWVADVRFEPAED